MLRKQFPPVKGQLGERLVLQNGEGKVRLQQQMMENGMMIVSIVTITKIITLCASIHPLANLAKLPPNQFGAHFPVPQSVAGVAAFPNGRATKC